MNLAYWTGWAISRLVGKVFFRMKVRRRDYIPKEGPFILACNHKSYLDPPLVGAYVSRQLHFMAKKELFKNRFFAFLLKRISAYPISRKGFDSTAVKIALAILQSGEALVIFPEGTRAKDEQLLPARPGIGMLARLSLVPVVPAYINGSERISACLMRKDRITLIFGDPLTSAQISTYDDSVEGYRALADAIMARIMRLRDEYKDKRATVKD
jgi:1-acyl-sn-glycerol-3-phosphate acyltransferase